ncbi:MAG: phosphoenolpyruvate---glycerone phosphotransferase subunit DhaL [Solirubrobacteraceae bacterium]|nr:phosphoenolpyruvate---glycerone phosphotransferase subunit DhaL [Solirubrobacteraceae bacterium]
MTITHDAIEDWMKRFAADVAENRAYLTKLDGAIGDGDHGTNMDRGMKKVLERLETTDGDDIGASLKAVGMTLVSSVGGAAGPLYGTLFLQMGQATAGRSELDLAGFTEALDAGVQGVIKRGKAEPGDKTMLDALNPALEALRAGDADDVAGSLARAAEAAREGMESTVPMVARKGRASYLGERSAGHQDPGATSSHLLLKTAAEAVGSGGAGG